MKTKILTLLRSNEEYISGQEICENLGVSRTAVWKVINQLREDGYEIESITNKGYKIITYPDIVSKSEIESRIKTTSMIKQVMYYEEVDSTNTVAKRTAEEKDKDGYLVIAEEQLQGKGRRGRSWSSPKGTGIWMSLIIKPDIKPMNASMLTLVAALSIVKSLKNLYNIDALVKWPNDIIINGKKVCGILTEMSAELDYINHIVIGIGINANTKEFPKELRNIATSLLLYKGEAVTRAELVVEIMKEFKVLYEVFLKKETLEDITDAYNEFLVNIGKEVVIHQGKVSYNALALGINSKGELLIKPIDASDGEEIKTIIAGEVSIRGVYGYV